MSFQKNGSFYIDLVKIKIVPFSYNLSIPIPLKKASLSEIIGKPNFI